MEAGGIGRNPSWNDPGAVGGGGDPVDGVDGVDGPEGTEGTGEGAGTGVIVGEGVGLEANVAIFFLFFTIFAFNPSAITLATDAFSATFVKSCLNLVQSD